ncbi:MAG: hypothetical protein WAN30_08790 [Acidimicrobiales bacterium]
MNKPWHHEHPLSRTATREQRIAWHAAHNVACHCRPAPKGLEPDIAAYRGPKD